MTEVSDEIHQSLPLLFNAAVVTAFPAASFVVNVTSLVPTTNESAARDDNTVAPLVTTVVSESVNVVAGPKNVIVFAACVNASPPK